MPTDIALVMVVVLILGKRVRTELKTFLLALAVADDLLSIVILGGEYSGEVKSNRGACKVLVQSDLGF
jgi:NhaA family Na+:H+ antiporter